MPPAASRSHRKPLHLIAAVIAALSQAPAHSYGATAADYESRFRDGLNCRLATNRYQPPNLAVSLDTTRPPPALPLVIRSDQGRLPQDWVFVNDGSYLVRVSPDCRELRSALDLPARQLLQLYSGQLKNNYCPRTAQNQPSDPAACRIGLQLRIDRIRRAIDPALHCDAGAFKQVLISLRDLPNGSRYLHGFETRSQYALEHLRREARRSFDRPWLQPAAATQIDLPPNPFVNERSYDAQLRSSAAFRGSAYPKALREYRSVLESCASTFPEVMPAKIARIDEIFGRPPEKVDFRRVAPAPTDSGHNGIAAH